MVCQLCGENDAALIVGDEQNKPVFMCKNCSSDVKRLFSLSQGGDPDLYNRYKQQFAEKYKGKNEERFIIMAERKAASSDPSSVNYSAPAPAERYEVNASSNIKEFAPFKLFLTTMFAVFALFMPCFGLGLAIISKRMASELPLDYITVDVNRARELSKIAVVLNVIEWVLAILSIIFILIINA